jgi:hypothetical protein
MKKKKFCKDEIIYKLIDAGLAGALVFVGSLTDGNVTAKGIITAVMAAAAITILKFRDYWDGKKYKFIDNLFCFSHL